MVRGTSYKGQCSNPEIGNSGKLSKPLRWENRRRRWGFDAQGCPVEMTTRTGTTEKMQLLLEIPGGTEGERPWRSVSALHGPSLVEPSWETVAQGAPAIWGAQRRRRAWDRSELQQAKLGRGPTSGEPARCYLATRQTMPTTNLSDELREKAPGILHRRWMLHAQRMFHGL